MNSWLATKRHLKINDQFYELLFCTQITSSIITRKVNRIAFLKKIGVISLNFISKKILGPK